MSEFSGPLTVVGAGVMGCGIAYLGVAHQLETRLVDVSETQLLRAEAQIGRDLEEGVKRGKISTADAERARKLLSTSTDLIGACADAQLVVEAAVEDMSAKQDILRRAEHATADTSILASNTSAMSITQIGSALKEPSRLVGMHFFNPVPRMRLCELVRGLQTSERTMELAEVAAGTMGKTSIRVEDLPGFATSRINALIGNEGLRMLEEGVAGPEDIDTAVRLGLNHPMGPLEMADLVGLDVRLAILETLTTTLGERFRPTNLHRRLVAAGRLGRKTGRGIYRYGPDGTRVDEASDLG